MEISRTPESARPEVAHIGKSVFIKGELSGSEDLYVDGEVEGSIQLENHHLTIGPHGRVRASVTAQQVVVHGKLEGNIQGRERVELKKSAIMTGDIVTKRIAIEDGAVFKGSVETQRETPKVEPKRETVEAVAASASGGGLMSATSGSATGVVNPHATLVEQKK